MFQRLALGPSADSFSWNSVDLGPEVSEIIPAESRDFRDVVDWKLLWCFRQRVLPDSGVGERRSRGRCSAILRNRRPQKPPNSPLRCRKRPLASKWVDGSYRGQLQRRRRTTIGAKRPFKALSRASGLNSSRRHPPAPLRQPPACRVAAPVPAAMGRAGIPCRHRSWRTGRRRG